MRKKSQIRFRKALLSLIILIGIFSLYLVMAENPEEKIKQHDYLKKKITISNNTEILADYFLTYNTDFCTKECYAEGNATLYVKEKLFSKLTFKDELGNIKNLKKYSVFIKNETGDEWEDYNFKKLEGTYFWRIEGNKKPRENIDWIVTSFGIELSEWEFWNSWQDWNDDFEDASINTTFWENDTSTCSFGGGVTPNAESLEISATDGYVKLRSRVVAGAGENKGAWVGFRTLQDFNDSIDYNINFTLNTSRTDQGNPVIRIKISNGTMGDITWGENCADMTKEMEGDILLDINTTTVTENYNIFINATSNNFTIRNSTSILNSIITDKTKWQILFVSKEHCGACGDRYNLIDLFNFTILSDVTMNVNLSIPIDDFWTSSLSNVFTCNSSVVDSTLRNVTLFIYNSTKDTVFSNSTDITGKSNSTKLTGNVSKDGAYEWNCEVFEYTNTSLFAESNFTLNVDTINPDINFTNPTPVNSTRQLNTDIYVNVSSNDTSEHYAFADFDNDLVLWWRMDESNGDIVFDNSTYGNNGTLINSTIDSEGYFGSAVKFNGTNNYINLTTPDIIEDVEGFTISFWVKTPQNSTGSMGLLDANVDDNKNLIRLFVAANRKLTWIIRNNSVVINQSSLETDNVFADNEWKHIIAMWNGSAVIYVNGSFLATGSHIGGNSLTGGAKEFLVIGRGNGLFWNGSLDEVLIFNRSLNDEEIFALYNASANQYFNNFTNLSEGNHTFRAYAVDKAGNLNQTEERIVEVISDIIGPAISLIGPADNSEDTDGIVTFSYNVTDDSDVDNCTIFIQGKESGESGDSQTDTSITKDTTQAFIFTNIIKSNNLEWSINCTDNLGNTANSSKRTVDTLLGSTGDDGTGGIKRAIPEICGRVFFFILETNWNFSLEDLNNSNLTIEDIENYPELCESIGFNKLPEKPKKFIITIPTFPKPENCSTEISRLFDISIPFFKIDLGEISCESINFWRWIIRLQESESYQMTGIKIYWMIFIFIIIILIWIIKGFSKDNRFRDWIWKNFKNGKK